MWNISVRNVTIEYFYTEPKVSTIKATHFIQFLMIFIAKRKKIKSYFIDER